MKPTLYLETTIISYLAAWPSRDIVVAAHQALTRHWWEWHRQSYVLYVSELVTEEATQGDADAAARRRALMKGCRILAVDTEELELAAALVSAGCLPKRASADAVHVAIAAVNGIQYLVTWNCAHINNAAAKGRMEEVAAEQGYRCPMICTPEELMGDT